MFYKEHFPYVKTSRGESAHLLESANSGLAVSHIPLTYPFTLLFLIRFSYMF